jgi:hypothetical protein
MTDHSYESVISAFRQVVEFLRETRTATSAALVARMTQDCHRDYDPMATRVCQLCQDPADAAAYVSRDREYRNPGWPRAYRILSSLPRPEEVLSLLDQAVQARDDYKREAIYILFFYAGDHEVFRKLMGSASDSVEARILCVQAIGHFHLTAYASFINTVLENDTDPEVLRVALSVVLTLHSGVNREGLIRFWQREMETIVFRDDNQRESLTIDALMATVIFRDLMFLPILESTFARTKSDLTLAQENGRMRGAREYKGIQCHILAAEGLYSASGDLKYLRYLASLLDVHTDTDVTFNLNNEAKYPITIPSMAAQALCNILGWDAALPLDIEALKQKMIKESVFGNLADQ